MEVNGAMNKSNNKKRQNSAETQASNSNALLVCPECRGSGVIDTGGSTPWGEGINVGCELCRGTGKTTRAEAIKAGWTEAH